MQRAATGNIIYGFQRCGMNSMIEFIVLSLFKDAWRYLLLLTFAVCCCGQQSPQAAPGYFYPPASHPSHFASSQFQPYPYSSHVGQWVIPAQALKSGVVEASSVVPFQVAAQRSSNGAVGKFGADQATEVGYPPVYYVLQPSYAGQSPFYAPAFQPYSQQVVLDGLTPLVYQQQPFFRTVGGLPPSLSVPLPPPANHGQC